MTPERKPVSQVLRELYAAAIPEGDRDDLRKLEHWLLDYGSAIVTCLEALEEIAGGGFEDEGDAIHLAVQALRSFDGGD